MTYTITEAAKAAEAHIKAKGWDLTHFSGVAHKSNGVASFRGVVICKGAGYSKQYSVHRYQSGPDGFHLWAGSYDLDLKSAIDLLQEKVGA